MDNINAFLLFKAVSNIIARLSTPIVSGLVLGILAGAVLGILAGAVLVVFVAITTTRTVTVALVGVAFISGGLAPLSWLFSWLVSAEASLFKGGLP